MSPVHSQLKLFLTFVLAAILALVLFFQFVPLRVDTLFVNATFYTMDATNSVAHALAVRRDRIVGLGEREEVERKFRAKQVIDLGGKTVLPGFIDAHVHLTSFGFARLTVNLVDTKSEAEIADRVRKRVEQVGDPEVWIRGRGWEHIDWQSKQFPAHQILDRVAPDNPVYLTRKDGRAVWVNKRVLELAGLTAQTVDPPGGRIRRDAQGNPTGVLIDAAIQLVAQYLPPPTEKEIAEATLLAVQECLQYGLTSVHDMGVGDQEIRVYKMLIDQHRLPLRIYAAIDVREETWKEHLQTGPEVGYGENRLTVRALKLYMDGPLGSRDAALIEPYSDDPDNRGLTQMTEENFRATLDDALAHGFQVCTHAIGDRGNSIVLNTYEAALRAHPQSDHRFRVEHAQVLNQNDIPRFKQLGILPSMQPTHCTSDMYWTEALIGSQRVRNAHAWRSLLNTGVIICGGSDFPAEHPNPLAGIYAAITRQDPQGRPADADDVKKYFLLSHDGITDPTSFDGGWYVSQKMTREEAIRSFTSWAAFGAFEERMKGSLEIGKLADFVLLSVDILKVPPRDILQAAVERSYIGGEEVYRRIAVQATSQQ